MRTRTRKAASDAWRNTPEGDAKYRACRAEAQKRANELGYDHGIEANDIFKEYRAFMLPRLENRYGFETRCEVVMPETLDKCKPGHGPMARRS